MLDAMLDAMQFGYQQYSWNYSSSIALCGKKPTMRCAALIACCLHVFYKLS
jgi:hypothetical protein